MPAALNATASSSQPVMERRSTHTTSGGTSARSPRRPVWRRGEWTPRELRHSFVSLLSDDGMPIEHIARLVGHTSTAVTETVYRQQIRPVIVQGAEAMDRIFGPKARPEA